MSFRFNPLSNSTQERSFKSPVRWLLSQLLLAALKWITIYAIYGTKLDLRDWMQDKILDYRDWTQDLAKQDWPEDEPFWFDYIADTGDGQRATYSIAYLCQGDLYLTHENCPPGPEQVSLQNGEYLLPRGQFLFVGGDTAYHIADLPTLAERFQKPFNWAYEDRFGQEPKDENIRPIFAIPANHDHYDFLDGFNRQFRIPLPDANMPPLQLKGYKRLQMASYVALHLPFNWWLLGIDTQNGKADRIDKRQQAFFHTILHPDDHKPNKLIIATPEPSTRFGQWATRDGEKGKLIDVFENQLGLSPCFLSEHQGNLPAAQCRLDISGDIHHYARYWGAGSGDSESSSRTNYASVVAGGGGAFLHPSHIDVNEVAHHSLYPKRGDSHRTMMKRLLNPWNVIAGGYVWLAGALTALITYFAVTIAQSSWSILKLIDDALRPCRGAPCGDTLLERIQAALFVEQGDTFSLFSQSTFELLHVVILVVFLWQWMSRLNGLAKIVSADPKEWLHATGKFLAPCLIAGLPILLFVATSGSPPGTFLASSIILAFAASSVLSLMIARRYADLVIERVKYEHSGTFADKLIVGFFVFFAVASFCYGLLRYGHYPVTVMFFDIFFLLILLLVGGGLVWLAGSYGAKLQSDTSGKLRFWEIGLWHAVMQITVPVCLVLYGSWQQIAIVTAVVLAVTEAVRSYYSYIRNDPNQNQADFTSVARLLFISWLILGLFTLSIIGWGTAVPVDWIRLALVSVLGALYSCVWFGWYMALTMSLNGHSNEAGGSARSEQYRHFIRFKLTRDTLTGYVIGIDNPANHIDDKGRFKIDSRLRLVDVFTLKNSG